MFERGSVPQPRRITTDPGVDDRASRVRAVVNALATVSLDDLAATQLRSETVELARLLASLQAQVFRRIAAVTDRAASGRVTGSASRSSETAAWLRAEVGLSAAEAWRWVRTAETLYPRRALGQSTTAVGPEPLVGDSSPKQALDGAPTSSAPMTESGAGGGLAITRTTRALEEGKITQGHAEVIARSLREWDAQGDAMPCGTSPEDDQRQTPTREQIEELLLERAVTSDVAATQRAALYVANTLDPAGSRQRRKQEQAERFLETSSVAGGGMRLRGYLVGSDAAALRAALDAFSAPAPADEVSPDPRTAAQRRADGLAEMSRRVLRAGSGPGLGGVRPQIQVLVPLPALEARGGRQEWPSVAGSGSLGSGSLGSGPLGSVTRPSVSEPTQEFSGDDEAQDLRVDRLESVDAVPVAVASPGGVTPFGQVLDAESVRQLACDAVLTRVVVHGASDAGPLGRQGALIRLLSAPSRPLDVGRSERSVTPSMRVALVARDRTCAFPGCDRPHTWCEAHHIRHWADGGPTSLENLVLLCSRHHTAVHHAGWRVAVDDHSGMPSFHPPWRDRHVARGADGAPRQKPGPLGEPVAPGPPVGSVLSGIVGRPVASVSPGQSVRSGSARGGAARGDQQVATESVGPSSARSGAPPPRRGPGIELARADPLALVTPPLFGALP